MVRGLRASFAVGENAPKDCDQPIKFDRFGVELVAPRRERLFAFTGERVRGESDNGDVAGSCTASPRSATKWKQHRDQSALRRRQRRQRLHAQDAAQLLDDFEVLTAEDGEKGCAMAISERPCKIAAIACRMAWHPLQAAGHNW